MIRRRRTAFVAISLVALVATVAGCGGGGGGDKGAANTPTPVLTSTPHPTAQPPLAWAIGTTTTGSAIIRSSDGGLSWVVAATLNATLMGLAFVDREVGWAVGFVGGPIILQTTDGGTTWIDQSGNVGTPRPSPLLNRVRFLDRNRGLAVGSEFPPVGIFGPPLVLTTVDGGANWLVASLPHGTRPSLSNAALQGACLTPEGLALAVGFGVSGNLVLLSHDFGSTWADITEQIVPLPIQPRATACVSPGSLWIVGGGTTAIVHSSDAGQTWTDQTAGIAGVPPGELLGVSFADGLVGWASGVGPAIFHTADGGTTWLRQTTPAAPPGAVLNAIAFSGASVGVSVGIDRSDPLNTHPLGFATSDGGSVWLSASLPSTPPLLSDASIVP